LLSGVLMGTGSLLLLTALSPHERVAIFPGVLFFGTALLQQYFGLYSFHWFGDVIIGYLLLAGIATLSYFLIEPVALKYLVFGLGLSSAAAFTWLAKHYVWPWRIIAQTTWFLPLLVVAIGLMICFYPHPERELWKKYRIAHHE